MGTAVVTAAVQTSSGVKFGLGVSDGTNSAYSFIEENTSTPTDIHSIQRTDKIFYSLNQSGTDNTVATLTSMDTDGFTINYTVAPGTTRYLGALALKGGKYKVAAGTQKTSTGTQGYSGIGFQPKGLLLMGTNRAATTSVDAAVASFSVGATDGTSQGAMWGSSTDNVGTTDENMATRTNICLLHATNPSTINAEASISSFGSDGYTLN